MSNSRPPRSPAPRARPLAERLLHSKALRGAAVALAAFALTLLLWLAGAFRGLEAKSWDARLRLFADPSRANPDIVLLAVDQTSLDVYEDQQGLPWPWPRQIYSAVLDFLSAGGAKAVFFDIFMTESSAYGIEDDAHLADAVSRAGNVFFPLFLSREERAAADASADDAAVLNEALATSALSPDRPVPPRALHTLRSVTLPVDVLAASARGLANVQFEPDPDAIYRRLPLVFRFGPLTLPSLPLALADFITAAAAPAAEPACHPLDLTRVPFDPSGRMILRFHGPIGTFKTYSIAAIINSQAQIEEGLAPQIDPALFAGKTVIIGTTAPGLFDLRPTPFGGVYPGMEILATALDNLLDAEYIRPAPAALTVAALLLLALLAGLGTTYLKRIAHLAVLLIAVLALPAAAAALALSAGVWLELAAPLFAVLSSFIAASLLNYGVEGRQRRFIKSAFRFYLSPDVIERVLSDPDMLRLGGERREITAFFSDLAGFTSISEGLSPEDLVALLNAYLSEMTDIILGSGGTLDKYEGDAIIAFWNAPLDQPDHPLRACRAALACQRRLADLRDDFRRRWGHELRMRIGLNSGPAVVGNMGSERRFDYTAMGDTMNLASRLEGVCKQYGIENLVSEETHSRVRGEILAREVDLIRVVGKKQPVRVFELVGLRSEVASETAERVARFERALEAYRARRFDEALAAFEELARLAAPPASAAPDATPAAAPRDPVAAIYAARCRDFAASPPPPDWDGVFEITRK